MTVSSSMFREWRCRCGRLLFRFSTGTRGPIEVKCRSCRTPETIVLGSGSGGSSSWA